MNDWSAIRHFAQSESTEAYSAMKALAHEGVAATVYDSASDQSTSPKNKSAGLVIIVKADEVPRATAILDRTGAGGAIPEVATSSENTSEPKTQFIAIAGYSVLIVGLITMYLEDVPDFFSYILIPAGILMTYASVLISRRRLRSA